MCVVGNEILILLEDQNRIAENFVVFADAFADSGDLFDIYSKNYSLYTFNVAKWRSNVKADKPLYTKGLGVQQMQNKSLIEKRRVSNQRKG